MSSIKPEEKGLIFYVFFSLLDKDFTQENIRTFLIYMIYQLSRVGKTDLICIVRQSKHLKGHSVTVLALKGFVLSPLSRHLSY